MNRWDVYFYKICEAVASKSSCKSRQIGALLVRDKSIISTGYNGPARGIPHCGPVCPRKAAGLASGEGLNLCPAQHAEENCINNAARIGASTLGSTLYLNEIIPCKDCFNSLINAGAVEIVCKKIIYYNSLTSFIHKNSQIIVREFDL